MKKPGLYLSVWIVSFVLATAQVSAQDEAAKSNFEVGADLYSSYVWRGSRLGGPSIQPSMKFVTGGLTLGVWGSFDATGYMETDPYVSYEFPFGLSLGFSDYYFPDKPLFDVSDSTGSHAFEINAGYTTGGLSLSANYILNEAGGAGSAGGDLYFQAGYEFKYFNIFIGAGDGWHTSDGEFAVCNIGIGTSKEIKITDTFSIPVTGQVICNPEKEALYLVVGFTL